MVSVYQSHPLIIRLLTEKPRSLADLQAATEVSLPKLRRVVQELTTSNWIRPVGQSIGTGRRPATLFGLSDSSYLIVGVHLQLPGIRLITVDLTGKVIDESRLPFNDSMMPNDAIREITTYVAALRKAHPGRDVLGVGVATPGYVDASSGEILTIERVPAWQSFPIRGRLEASLNLPITIANDIDALATAELRYTDTRSSHDLIYLGYTDGIKTSMFLNGDLYKGPFGNAGILGRIVIDDDGTRLEEVASVSAICDQFDQHSDSNNQQHRQIGAIPDRHVKFLRILELAASGDSGCAAILEQATDKLALSISNLLCLLQPSVLVIGGTLSTMPVTLFEQFERLIRRRLPPLISNRLVIEHARLTAGNGVAVGVAHQFLLEYLNSERFIQHVSETA